MTPARQLKKLEARAVRAALHPLLSSSLVQLQAGAAGLAPATFLGFLSELAHALLNYRKGTSREQRRALRRVVFQPRDSDAEFLLALVTSILIPPAPAWPGLH